jgi:hypothetical protein
MQSKLHEELEVIRLELARRNEAWARTRAGFAALGERVLAVPRESLERIDAACAPHVERLAYATLRA